MIRFYASHDRFGYSVEGGLKEGKTLDRKAS